MLRNSKIPSLPPLVDIGNPLGCNADTIHLDLGGGGGHSITTWTGGGGQ